MKTLNSNTVELHYHFTDHEHRIDAFVQNRCEHELLVLMKELTKYFEFEFFSVYISGAGLVDCMATLDAGEPPYCFPKWIHQFTCPLTI